MTHQEEARRVLEAVLAGEVVKGQTGHAYLLRGENGPEQAILLAQSLNCLQPESGQPCGLCPPCRKIQGGCFADVVVVNPQKGYLRIDQMREVQARAALAPLEGRMKVFIIQEAEAMQDAAANSLLKILEEPPDRTVFILTAANSDKLPTTVLSRCRCYQLGQEQSFVIDEAQLASYRTAAHQFLEGLDQSSRLQMLRLSKNYDKDKDGLLYFFLAIWQLLAADAKGEGRYLPMDAALKAALFVERALDLLRRNANQRLLSDVVFLRLWQMRRKV